VWSWDICDTLVDDSFHPPLVTSAGCRWCCTPPPQHRLVFIAWVSLPPPPPIACPCGAFLRSEPGAACRPCGRIRQKVGNQAGGRAPPCHKAPFPPLSLCPLTRAGLPGDSAASPPGSQMAGSTSHCPNHPLPCQTELVWALHPQGCHMVRTKQHQSQPPQW